MNEGMSRENRRSARVRRVLPIGFKETGDSTTAAARMTVSANVSRGGMLLATRQDDFPATGIWVDLMPLAPTGRVGDGSIFSGRIVHKRYSPDAELSFAGLEFSEELSLDAARAVGLNTAEDDVIDAETKLQELEDLSSAKSPGEPVPIAPKEGFALLGKTLDMCAETSDLQAEAERLNSELEMTRKRLMDETCSFVRGWAEKKLVDTVVECHKLSRAKGTEGLRALKSELTLLSADYPALIDAQLNRDEHWPCSGEDKRASGAESYYDAENEKPAPWFVDELRRLMGFAGVLLVKHGFDELSKRSDWAPVSRGRALVVYRGRFAISDEMAASLKRAAALFNAMLKNETRLREARTMQEGGEARRIWDEC